MNYLNFQSALAEKQSSVAEMLLEFCVTELEDVAADMETIRSLPSPVVQESSHPYSDNSSLNGRVKIPGMVPKHFSQVAIAIPSFSRLIPSVS